MQKTGILTASFFMLSAVMLGAFGAHGLKSLLNEAQLAAFKTGVFYQFVHAIGIFITVILANIYHLPKLKWSFYFLVIGIVLFCGSLYLLSTQSLFGIPLSFLGPITPTGGLFFILAWTYLFYSIAKKSDFDS